MSDRRTTSLSALVVFAVAVLVDSAATAAQATDPPALRAGALAGAAIHVDGRLDEPVWLTAEPTDAFLQTDPQEGTDALFATDNKKAGILIGQYAKAAMGSKAVKIATLDLAPGITVGVLRHDGFLEGFGIKNGDPKIVCSNDTQGDQAKGQTAMEN